MKNIVVSAKPFPFLLKILIPIFIGLSVTILLYSGEFSLGRIDSFPSTLTDGIAVGLAFLFMGMKDFAFSLRYRYMSHPALLSWKGAIKTNYLCEFTSAVTPSAMGGSALLVVYLHHEGITAGRSTAVLISTLFLDELIFVLICPFCLLLFSPNELFGISLGLSSGLKYTFSFVYIVIAVYATLLYIALFRKPEVIQNILSILVKLPFLRRYEPAVLRVSQDIKISSEEMKKQPFSFWIKAFAITSWAWISRYAVACALFFPFIPTGKLILVLCRQFILWIVMMITPTPGGSGVSEYLFSQYYSDMLTTRGDILFITCFWRIMTYYFYLFIGLSILPTWMKKKLKK